MEGNGDDLRVHDREAEALGLSLGLLHIVDALRYAVAAGTHCVNGRVEGDDVLGLSATTAEELVGRYLQIEGFRVAEAAYPHVLDDRKNKLAGRIL